MKFIFKIRSRNFVVLFGFFSFIILFIQTFLLMNDPVSSTGFVLDLKKDTFSVQKVEFSSLAAIAGISIDTNIVSINGYNANTLYNELKSSKLSEFMNKSSSFFQFGKTYTCIDDSGKSYTFVLKQQSGYKCFFNLSNFIFIKLLVSILFIACGIFCLFYYNVDSIQSHFFIFIFATSLVINNLFISLFNSNLTSLISCFVLDIGSIIAGTALIAFFHRSFILSNIFKRFTVFLKYLRYFPGIFFGTKYGLLLLGIGNIFDGPLYFFSYTFLVALSSFVLFCGSIMIVKFPRKMTFIFRFFILGYIFVMIPISFYLLRTLLTLSFIMSETEQMIMILSFCFIPISITLSTIQSREVKTNYLTQSIMTWLAYIDVTSCVIILSEFFNVANFSILEKKIAIFALILIAPTISYFLKVPIRQFLSLSTKELQEKLLEYASAVAVLDTPQDIFEETSQTIMSEINSNYVFFQVTPVGESSRIAYVSKRNVPNKLIKTLIAESEKESQKHRAIILLPNGGFSAPLFRGEQIYGRIFVSRKHNKVDYLPTERFFVTQIANYLLQSLLYQESLKEKKERQQLQTVFSKYLSPAWVNEILLHPEIVRPGGEKKVLTVLFSDIQGFTPLSESKSADVILRILNTYLNEMSAVILSQGGTIDKFEGDAIMAFFGAPISYQDHAIRACRAALQMQKMQDILNSQLQSTGLISEPINTRIGVNTGEMIIGNVGSIDRLDYTVIGNEVNVASRIEETNKMFDTAILISEQTYVLIKDAFNCRCIGRGKLRGMQSPIQLFELISEKPVLEPKKDIEPIESFDDTIEPLEELA